MNFNPYIYQQYPQYQQNMFQAQQPQQNQDERIWVQNATAAESYLVAPNSFVRLWNSTEPIFYEKRADATGRPLPIEAFKYEKISAVQPVLQQSRTIDYSDEINALKRRIEALERGAVNESESNGNDNGVSAVQK